jgi:hypothetical protein
VEENFWKYIPRDNTRGDRDISREVIIFVILVPTESQLTRFLVEVIGEDSPTLKILKTCNQSIIAPAVTELTLNVVSQLSFKDGGTNNICLTHPRRWMENSDTIK